MPPLELSRTNRRILVILLNNLTSTTLSDQRVAARKLFSITKKLSIAQHFFGESHTVLEQLINPLVKKKRDDEIDTVLLEDLIGTISHISPFNINMVTTTPGMIPVLAECLKSGRIQTKRDTLNTILTLSIFQRYSIMLCEQGVLSTL